MSVIRPTRLKKRTLTIQGHASLTLAGRNIHFNTGVFQSPQHLNVIPNPGQYRELHLDNIVAYWDPDGDPDTTEATVDLILAGVTIPTITLDAGAANTPVRAVVPGTFAAQPLDFMSGTMARVDGADGAEAQVLFNFSYIL